MVLKEGVLEGRHMSILTVFMVVLHSLAFIIISFFWLLVLVLVLLLLLLLGVFGGLFVVVSISSGFMGSYIERGVGVLEGVGLVEGFVEELVGSV